MEFFKNIGKAISNAADYVGEKNRKAAYLNRIRTVLKCEERAAEKEYLALGRYYYNNLRDKENAVTEAHCAELEIIEERMEKALNQLERYYQGECGETDFSEEAVPSEGEAEEITLDDVESFDQDPMAAPSEAGSDAEAVTPAEPGENDNLPFEG